MKRGGKGRSSYEKDVVEWKGRGEGERDVVVVRNQDVAERKRMISGGTTEKVRRPAHIRSPAHHT